MHRRSLGIRRIIVRAVAFLLLGAIVNVGVAWALAVRPIDRSDPFSDRNVDSPRGWFSHWDDRYATCKNLFIRTGEFQAVHDPKRWLGTPLFLSWLDEARFPDAIPKWSKFHDEGWPLSELFVYGETRDVDYLEKACGWPMYAVRYEWIREFNRSVSEPNATGSHGLLLLPARWLPQNLETELPWSPLWPGFAIDTVLYAMILWLITAAPLALRRRWRIRRGLCPACAYPTGASPVCTECGHAVSKPTGARTD